MDVIYLDNNATTRIANEVREAMLPFLSEQYGNPSSIHTFGSQVRRKIEQAREEVANLINADPDEIVFTSCGTESDNTAIMSAIQTFPEKRHIVTTSVEHPAVRNLCNTLKSRGYEVTFLRVDEKGMIDLNELSDSIRNDTAIVSIMYANNETGVIFPVKEAVEIAKSKGVIFHTDAVQAVGKVEIDVKDLNVDMLSISGHKFHAPKGIGALYIKRGTPFHPYLIGGNQENGRRSGTENVASIVGLGMASRLAKEYMDHNDEIRRLRDMLEKGLLESCPGARVNGDIHNRLPNTSNISFEYIDGEAILLKLNEYNICASSGSACSSGSSEPSHVLRAMGVPYTAIHGSIRFSLSRYNTEKEIKTILTVMPEIVKGLRELSPYT